MYNTDLGGQHTHTFSHTCTTPEPSWEQNLIPFSTWIEFHLQHTHTEPKVCARPCPRPVPAFYYFFHIFFFILFVCICFTYLSQRRRWRRRRAEMKRFAEGRLLQRALLCNWFFLRSLSACARRRPRLLHVCERACVCAGSKENSPGHRRNYGAYAE